jgi:integrase
MSFLFDQSGKRKYLTAIERRAFIHVAKSAGPEIYTFCAALAYTGARVSEVLALVHERVDFIEKVIVIESLKKRRKGVFRAIPVPTSFLVKLDEVHHIQATTNGIHTDKELLWPWCRTTAYNYVTEIMHSAGIEGSQCSPKGLRHSFGTVAIQNNVPLPTLQKWMGHTHIETTAIYAQVVGEEERNIARQHWRTFK